ncbi:MAG: 50S ribosomal protein L11 methyltransferase [Ilumatobacteraceae bacterium]
MLAFVVRVAPDEVDLASDRLWQLGVRGVEERPVDEEWVELWSAVGEDSAAIERAASVIGDDWAWRTEEVADAHPETWRDHARPRPIGGRLLVVPAWQADAEVDTAGDRIPILVEPGAAFGFGDHPTTELTLQALEREVRPSGTVLDVGCGTGILAIAAVKLGAGRVRAFDLATAAVEATTDNARRNGVEGRVEVDTTAATDLEGRYDLVLANILAPTLVALAPDLRRLTAPGGQLVISGILADAHDHVLDALAPMHVDRTDTLAGWAAVTLSI